VHGVLVAVNGITGCPQDPNAAHDAVRMASAVEKIRVIVITRAEIETWTDTSLVIELFKKKLCELNVDGSIFV
jgi:hypothetical protein